MSAGLGQPLSHIVLGTITDDAGAATLPGDLSATVSLNGVSYAATLVGDGAGNYSVTAGVPGQAVGYESGTITVVNANNNVSETWNNGFSINVFNDLGSAAGLSATVAGPHEVDLGWPTVSTSGYFDALQVERQGSADGSPTVIATLAPGAREYATAV